MRYAATSQHEMFGGRRSNPVHVSHDKPFAVMGFTVTDGLIREIDVVLDPVQLGRMALA